MTTEWIPCPANCDNGQVEHWGDRFNPMTDTHGTWHSEGPCETCDGNGEIEVEEEPAEPLLNDHPDFEMVFWWKPIAPPEYANRGPFLDTSRNLANRQQAGGQLAIIPRPDLVDRPSYSASDAAIMRRWPRLVATVAAMNNLYVGEAAIAIRGYLGGYNSVEQGYFGKTCKDLIEGALRDRFESWKEGEHPDFMKGNMARTATWRRQRCKEMAAIVRQKGESK